MSVLKKEPKTKILCICFVRWNSLGNEHMLGGITSLMATSSSVRTLVPEKNLWNKSMRGWVRKYRKIYISYRNVKKKTNYGEFIAEKGESELFYAERKISGFAGVSPNSYSALRGAHLFFLLPRYISPKEPLPIFRPTLNFPPTLIIKKNNYYIFFLLALFLSFPQKKK